MIVIAQMLANKDGWINTEHATSDALEKREFEKIIVIVKPVN